MHRSSSTRKLGIGEALRIQPRRPPPPIHLSVLLAVLSDIHANLAALESSLRLAEVHGVDAVYGLGDIVGYGPDPGPCVDLLRANCAGCVLGNHDEAVAFGRGVEDLPLDGQEAAALHRTLLTDEQLDWLRGLPLRLVAHDATFVHASPDAPGAWHRLDGYYNVRSQFSAFATSLCFVGHSHRPAVVADALGVFAVRPGHRFLIDVGSVGQPRDHDPRAAFALYDTEAFECEFVRAPYDVEATARRIAEIGLPDALAERLRWGL
ncbi:MAG: metallophosphoesterase family protein [Rubricoccaceae bacterium]|nr:metallophosphoesterase family protein [Rubricoccaceae bacterium]